MITEKLTGNTRHRVQKKWHGYHLVLQVEVRRKGTYYSCDPQDPLGRDIDDKYWRDAKLEDLECAK